MQTIIPNNYQDLLERAGTFESCALPEASELLKGAGFKEMSLINPDVLFYVVDYTKNKYLYLDPSFQTVLGYNQNRSAEAGPVYFTGLWHSNDYKIFHEHIFPEAMRFLKKQPPYSFCHLSFSFNYRIRTKWGDYLTWLQRSTYFMGDSGLPLASAGFAIDITHFKDGTRIIHTIEKIGNDFKTLSATPLLKSVYYPDRINDLFSKREMEVLQCVAKGKNSQQISDELSISVHTVNNHRRNMQEKTGTSNSVELLNFALKQGFL